MHKITGEAWCLGAAHHQWQCPRAMVRHAMQCMPCRAMSCLQERTNALGKERARDAVEVADMRKRLEAQVRRMCRRRWALPVMTAASSSRQLSCAVAGLLAFGSPPIMPCDVTGL